MRLTQPPYRHTAYVFEDKRIRNKSHRRLDKLTRTNKQQKELDALYAVEYSKWDIEHGDEWLNGLRRMAEPPMICTFTSSTGYAEGDVVWDKPKPSMWKRLCNYIKEAIEC